MVRTGNRIFYKKRNKGDGVKMDNLSNDEILTYLKNNRKLLHDNFGVTSIGIFGSFVQGTQTSSSDIDIVIDMEKTRKSIHTFLQLKKIFGKRDKKENRPWI
ncbi:MAG: nucleotidyltransferase domain-containing protein [Nitrospirae bacterium]|nr:nucleotidyltransferase domain-containing protein [Nitrospirota bacterium]